MAIARTVPELVAMRPFGGWRTFLADPAWRQEMRSAKGEGKAPQAKYHCMTPEEIAALPVDRIAAHDAILFVWTTAPNLAQAIAIIPRWGFVYKSAAAWAKESKNSGPFETDDEAHKFAFGNGYIFRSAAEFLLVATRGSPTWNDTKAARSVRNLIYAPVREHSRKPDSQYEIVETLTIGPFLEMFSRTPRDGWDAFGDQAETFASV